MNLIQYQILTLLVLVTTSIANNASEGDQWTFEPDPNLPNVLILGDSISIGYTLGVREILSGRANVFRPMGRRDNRRENCGGTTYGVENIDRWISVQKWDIIHFNWGLHDLKHVKAAGTNEKSNSPDDPTQATVEVYEANLQKIVEKLQETGATLIFATTTPVVPDTLNPLRLPDAPAQYNAAAVRIMKREGIQVNHLHTYVVPNLKIWQKPRNVHFNELGSSALAEKVAATIAEALSANELDGKQK